MRDRPATYQDVLDAPEGFVAELIDGELFLQARPAPAHALTHSALCSELHVRFHGRDADGPGGWVILYEPELWLGRPDPRSRVLVPDVAGWRLDHFRHEADAVGLTAVPDFVCEVLSPGTVRHDRLRKLEVYRQSGVAWVWLVDPVAELVEVYEQVDGAWVLRGGAHSEEPARLPPFHAVPLRVHRWWASALDSAPRNEAGAPADQPPSGA